MLLKILESIFCANFVRIVLLTIACNRQQKQRQKYEPYNLSYVSSLLYIGVCTSQNYIVQFVH